MPEGPAPTPVLSKTTTSLPDPSPRASSSFARCHAVESPWTPAPITTNRELLGREGMNRSPYCWKRVAVDDDSELTPPPLRRPVGVRSDLRELGDVLEEP